MSNDERVNRHRHHRAIRRSAYFGVALGMLLGASTISIAGLPGWGLVGFFALAFLYGWHDNMEE